MNPFRHGEVFVLDDGSEVDMDFGTYERFLNSDLNASFSMTGGKVFTEIISRERKGDYLGNDVQIIPHLTDYIVEKIQIISEREKLDVMLIEVGGTVGDIENNYFVEAMRQLALKRKVVFVDITYVPELEKVGEQKTKPTQMALRSMRQEGIAPDFILCRSDKELNDKARRKIALFSNLPPERVMDDHDLGNIYWLPMHLMKQGFDKMLIKELGLEMNALDENKLASWKSIVDTRSRPKKPLTIAVVGKYVDLHDSYASVKEALVHAALVNDAELNINWVESESLEESSIGSNIEILKGSDGILVPGGFGGRGIEGMIKAIEYARVNKIPYLGLCLGMQLMAIEYARNVCGLNGASSTEFGECEHRIIDIMEEQKKVTTKGATMRLGAWEAKIKPNTIAHSSYGAELVSERHRHRYEFNNEYRKQVEEKGLVVSGTTPDGNLVEFIEWKDSFGIGTQAHPEFKSRPERPAPLFRSFIKSAMMKKDGNFTGRYSYTLSASA